MHTPNYDQRFAGIARLYGREAQALLARAHFLVIGLGGVGSWAAEALARSGIAELTLVDLDEVCVSNTNRQSHALSSALGRAKTDVVAERLRDINPELNVHVVQDFLTKHNMREVIAPGVNVVIDAMDSVHVKTALVAYCSAIKLRLICVGSSGGKRDPRLITVADLANTESDPMLAKIRQQLFRIYKFSRDTGRKFRVDAVYSTEHRRYPKPDGSVCTDKSVLSGGTKLDCASGFGASVMVTGSFGFVAAAQAIERYLSDQQNPERATD